MYQDKPSPSRVLVVMFGCLVLLPLGVLMMVILQSVRTWHGSLIEMVIGLSICVPLILAVCAGLIWLMRQSYQVEYTVSNGAVKLRCGRLYNETIQVKNIISVRRVRMISRVLGWGFLARGCCNRFTRGLLLKTKMGNVFVSPSDIERFCTELGVSPTE